jgi:hypothetical protein
MGSDIQCGWDLQQRLDAYFGIDGLCPGLGLEPVSQQNADGGYGFE